MSHNPPDLHSRRKPVSRSLAASSRGITQRTSVLGTYSNALRLAVNVAHVTVVKASELGGSSSVGGGGRGGRGNSRGGTGIRRLGTGKDGKGAGDEQAGETHLGCVQIIILRDLWVSRGNNVQVNVLNRRKLATLVSECR